MGAAAAGAGGVEISLSNSTDWSASTAFGSDWADDVDKIVTIPAGVTLVLTDNLAFDKTKYNLRMEVTGTSPTLDVIIK